MIEFVIFSSLMSAVIAWMLFAPFGKTWQGFVLGLVLGPFGVIVAAVQRSNWKEEAVRRQNYLTQREQSEEAERRRKDEGECPSCLSSIPRRATVCRYCGRDVVVA
ncbi:MAG TPA: hypothetical protein VJZ00_09890 [Thermoanaerobaculia bacterium]|nr:hypothetical protein [Thermoanaerobaculia bacterium]